MKKLLLPALIILTSCSFFAKELARDDAQKKSATPANFSLVFSHNISGETHPCGCRNFPLGGLPQVAGLFSNLSKNGEVFYVDTGDTFFPSSVIPSSMKDSLSFAANNLALGLDQLGLKYLVPGDQDFAMGVDFLKKMAAERKFEFLISNLKDENTIKHKRYALIERNKAKIWLLGFVAPDVFNDQTAGLFTDVAETLPKMIEELKAQGYRPNDSYQRLVVLSHAGIDPDEKLAEAFPFIDWMIGAHSQSFLRFSRDVGNVKIVQTLSKNHYVGDIKIDTNARKESDVYELHEIRDELQKNLDPNPFIKFIDDHKNKMSELQMAEQSQMGMDVAPAKAAVKKYKTAASCMECHKPQVQFWQGTPHSIAYTTLIKVKEENNLQCIKCHTLGLNDPKGFTNPTNMVTFRKKQNLSEYWNQVKALSSDPKSVRKMDAREIAAISKKWMALDAKSGVKNNFANVQCLNCHAQNDEHPFNADAPVTKEHRMAEIKNKCLSCHTKDQSPEWSDEKIVEQKIKKVSCPLL